MKSEFVSLIIEVVGFSFSADMATLGSVGGILALLKSVKSEEILIRPIISDFRGLIYLSGSSSFYTTSPGVFFIEV